MHTLSGGELQRVALARRAGDAAAAAAARRADVAARPGRRRRADLAAAAPERAVGHDRAAGRAPRRALPRRGRSRRRARPRRAWSATRRRTTSSTGRSSARRSCAPGSPHVRARRPAPAAARRQGGAGVAAGAGTRRCGQRGRSGIAAARSNVHRSAPDGSAVGCAAAVPARRVWSSSASGSSTTTARAPACRRCAGSACASSPARRSPCWDGTAPARARCCGPPPGCVT